MPASFDLDPYPAPLAGSAMPVGVYRYDPTLPADERYAVVPNVRCESIQYREGAEPPVARFRYVLDDSAAGSDLPAQFEDLWPLDADGPYVVRNDDRIVVLGTTPSGRNRVLFDGFAQVPEVELCAGLAARLVPRRRRGDPLLGPAHRRPLPATRRRPARPARWSRSTCRRGSIPTAAPTARPTATT